MEFDKSRVYTALNADELKQGDKVIVAQHLGNLKYQVSQKDYYVWTIKEIKEDICSDRFITGNGAFPLAYLIERAENCTNCGCVHCWYREKHGIDEQRLHTCSRRIEPKTQQKAEKHYRPFRDTDELIKVWCKKCPAHNHRERGLTMPLIWVKNKDDDTDRGRLIISFSNNGCSVIDVDEIKVMLWENLFEKCTFLDGSPCGVEE